MEQSDDSKLLKQYIEDLEAVANTVSRFYSVSVPKLMRRWRLFMFGLFCGFKASGELAKVFEISSDALEDYEALIEHFPDFEAYQHQKSDLST